MKKLILHSDQIVPGSFALDRTIFEFVKERPVRVAYIASKTDSIRKYFRLKQEYYAQLGITDVKYFDFDQEISEAQAKELGGYHVFHLSGGDTNYFLTSLRTTCGLRVIKEYALAGKVLVGISAGAIITGKDINISALLGETIVPEPGGLSLVDFEFFPHYQNCEEINEKLRQYTSKSHIKVYACADGNGVAVEDDKVRFFGEVFCFQDGAVTLAVER